MHLDMCAVSKRLHPTLDQRLQDHISLLDEIPESMRNEDHSLAFSHSEELIEEISFCDRVKGRCWLVNHEQPDVTVLHPHERA